MYGFIFSIGLFIQGSDSLPGTQYFSKCVKSDWVTHHLFLAGDSSVLFREHAEQWTTGIRRIGRWKSCDSTFTIQLEGKDSSLHIYRVSSIRYLVYLIPDKNFEENRKLLTACIENKFSEEFSDFTLVAKDKAEEEKVHKRIDYRYAQRCTCGKDILFEVPEEFIDTDFKTWRDVSGKKKK